MIIKKSQYRRNGRGRQSFVFNISGFSMNMQIFKSFYIKTKLSPSHKMPLYKYISIFIFNIWNYLPNIFIKAKKLKSQFVFVCGCGHSGTTLVAAKLGLHDDVFFTGRETNVFFPANDMYSSRKIILEWDHMANLNGRSHVLEKTPKHIYSIKNIKKVVPKSKFIIITRNPIDSVSSLYQRFGDLDACISRWIEDNRSALHWVNDPSVLFVKYEHLVGAPEKEFKGLFDFAGLKWDPCLLDARPTAYEKVAQKNDLHKKRVEQIRKPIKPNYGTWKSSLTAEEAGLVFKRTASVRARLGYDSIFLERFGIFDSQVVSDSDGRL